MAMFPKEGGVNKRSPEIIGLAEEFIKKGSLSKEEINLLSKDFFEKTIQNKPDEASYAHIIKSAKNEYLAKLILNKTDWRGSSTKTLQDFQKNSGNHSVVMKKMQKLIELAELDLL